MSRRNKNSRQPAQPYDLSWRNPNGVLHGHRPDEAGPSYWRDLAFHQPQPRSIPSTSHGQNSVSWSTLQADRQNQTQDRVVELEGHAKEAVSVLRLKNAITLLADVVALYDSVDSATGRKSTCDYQHIMANASL